MAESHVFAHITDGGLYHREVRLDADGGLTVIGHDLGETEYEFERRVSPDGVRRLLASISDRSSRPPLEVMREVFTSAHEIEQRLEELEIETQFWSRFG